MHTAHCIIWMDHKEARLFAIDMNDVELTTIPASHQVGHLHHRAGTLGSGKPTEDRAYFTAIEAELRKFGEFLLVGPGTAKLDLVRHIERHAADLKNRLVTVKAADHPTDPQIVAYARKFFKASDRMRHSNADLFAHDGAGSSGGGHSSE